MYASFDFYQNDYKGFLIPSDDYAYFAERASDELAPYAARIGAGSEEKTVALSKAQCRIAEILYGDFKASKYGTAKVTSESVNGYYSTTFSAASQSEIRGLIANAIRTYLGSFLYRHVKVVY